MAHNIGIYSRPFYLQNHKDAKLYHNTTLGLNKDKKYYLSKDKIKTSACNFALQVKNSIGMKS